MPKSRTWDCSPALAALASEAFCASKDDDFMVIYGDDFGFIRILEMMIYKLEGL